MADNPAREPVKKPYTGAGGLSVRPTIDAIIAALLELQFSLHQMQATPRIEAHTD